MFFLHLFLHNHQLYSWFPHWGRETCCMSPSQLNHIESHWGNKPGRQSKWSMTEVCLSICCSPPAFTQWTQGAHWITALSSLNGGNPTEKEDNVYSEDCCYCCSVAKLCPTLHDPMYCSTPAFPICQHLPEFAQAHVHWIGDAIQLSHPLLPASPSVFSLSQHQGIFQWVFASSGQGIGASASASALPMSIQGWFPLRWTGLISLQSKGLSGVFSNSTVQKHQSSALSFPYGPTLASIHDYWKNHSFDWTDLCQ